MSGMQEVPTDELLSFQEFPSIPIPSNYENVNTTASIQITDDIPRKQTSKSLEPLPTNDNSDPLEENKEQTSKSFFTLKYYQRYFDVDTSEVIERLIASIIPRRNNVMNNKIKLKPDLYGPFWISMTLIFTIAISGNIANYLQHANAQYHWKYNFHLVSYASTAILFYISLVPLLVWGLLKWSTDTGELEQLVEETLSAPLELICVYGYSLFIYIPVSILWWIQIRWLQWVLALVSAFLSGSVLVFKLYPAIQLSKHKFILVIGVCCCHLLLAASFVLFFFHESNTSFVTVSHATVNATVVNVTAKA